MGGGSEISCFGTGKGEREFAPLISEMLTCLSTKEEGEGRRV